MTLPQALCCPGSPPPGLTHRAPPAHLGQVELYGQCPAVDKMDATLSTLKACKCVTIILRGLSPPCFPFLARRATLSPRRLSGPPARGSGRARPSARASMHTPGWLPPLWASLRTFCAGPTPDGEKALPRFPRRPPGKRGGGGSSPSLPRPPLSVPDWPASPSLLARHLSLSTNNIEKISSLSGLDNLQARGLPSFPEASRPAAPLLRGCPPRSLGLSVSACEGPAALQRCWWRWR